MNDIKHKYLKYKKKYNDFKGGSSLSSIPEDDNKHIFSNITFDSTNKILELKYNKNGNNINFKFNLSNNFPSNPPILYKNNIITNIGIEWNIHTSLIQILKTQIERDENEFKILIFCHAKPTIDNHFLYNDIMILAKEAGIDETKPFTIDTLDIIEGGTYKVDGFSDEFINVNLNKYNLVVIPDCGGDWVSFQEPNYEELLIDKIINVLKLVKDNGIIVFGKIISDNPVNIKGENYNNLIDAIIYYIIPYGFITKIITIQDTPESCISNKLIVAQKNNV